MLFVIPLFGRLWTNQVLFGSKQCFLAKLINYLPSLTSSTFSSKDHRFSFPKEFLLLISILLHLLIFLSPLLCIFKSCQFFFCICFPPTVVDVSPLVVVFGFVEVVNVSSHFSCTISVYQLIQMIKRNTMVQSMQRFNGSFFPFLLQPID